MTATRSPRFTTDPNALYLAFELGQTAWKLAFRIGLGQKPRLRSLPAVFSTGGHGVLAFCHGFRAFHERCIDGHPEPDPRGTAHLTVLALEGRGFAGDGQVGIAF